MFRKSMTVAFALTASLAYAQITGIVTEPGGSDGQLQYGASGIFGGVTGSAVSGADVTFGGTVSALSFAGSVTPASVDLSTVTTRFLLDEGYITTLRADTKATTDTLRTDLSAETVRAMSRENLIGTSTGTTYSALNSTGSALTTEISRAKAREDLIGTSTGTIYAALNSTGSALTTETARAIAAEGGKAPLTGEGTSGTWGISVTGNAGTSSALDHNPSACTGSQFVTDIAADGTLTCGDTPTGAGETNTYTSSKTFTSSVKARDLSVTYGVSAATGVFTGAVSVDSMTVYGSGGNQLALAGTDGYNGLKFKQNGGKYNFLIGAQFNVNNALEFTPSTAANGDTFSTPAMTILAGGNVGIGVTSPSVKLDVLGTIASSGATAEGFTAYGNGRFNTNGTNSAGVYVGPTGNESSILYLSNGNMSITPRSGYNLVIPSGNVGIGGTTATSPLYVTGNAYFTADVSALTFTDRTPYPKDTAEAYRAVKSMKRKAAGGVDHDALDTFIRAEPTKRPKKVKVKRVVKGKSVTVEEDSKTEFLMVPTQGRNLSATVSAQNAVIQDLLLRIEALEKK